MAGKYTVPDTFYFLNSSDPNGASILIPNATGVFSVPTPLQLGRNNLTLFSTQDAWFRVTVYRALPDVSNLGLVGYDSAGAAIYTPVLQPSFTAGVFTYSVSVPYGMYSASNFGTTSAGTITSSGGETFQTSMPLAYPGASLYTISSSIDGDYVFSILRLPPDVTSILYEGRNTYLNYWQNLFLTGKTTPKYVANTGQFDFSSTVKYEVRTVRFNLMWTSYPDPAAVVAVFLQNNATRNISTFQSNVDYGNYTTPVDLVVGPNRLIIFTHADGNYTFDVYRNASLVNPCLSRPCLFGSTCWANYSIQYNAYYSCACVTGYSGQHCDIPDGPLTPPLLTGPVAVLAATSKVLGNCDTLILDGRSSFGQLTSPFGANVDPATVQYSFFVHAILTADGVDLVATNQIPLGVNISLGTGIGEYPLGVKSYLTVPAIELLGNVTYEVGLIVSNDQVSSLPVYVTFTKLLNDTCIPWMPSVAILPPSLIQRSALNTFKVQLTPGHLPLPADAIMTFDWAVSIKQNGQDVDTLYSPIYPSHLSLRQRELNVPPFWLIVHETYYLHLTVTVTSPSGGGNTYSRRLLAVQSLTGSTDCQVTVNVPPSNLVAFIFGGDRERRNDLPMQLDGSRSTDPDNSNLAVPPISWAWSCAIISDVSYLATQPPPCAIPAGQANLEIITLPTGSLDVGVTYSFTLTVASTLPGDSRTATTTVRALMLPTPAVPTPVVLIIDAPKQINIQDILRLQAYVVSTSSTPLYQLEYKWSCDPALDLSDSTILGGLPDAINLIVKPNVFQPGFRTFTITVTDPANNATASASALISVNFPPAGGSCSVTPSEGRAFSTSFYVACADWYDPNGAEPFTYGLKYLNLDRPSQGLLTLVQQGWQPYVNLLLPNGRLQLVVSITDTLGAVAYYPLDANATLSPECLACPLECVQNLLAVRRSRRRMWNACSVSTGWVQSTAAGPSSRMATTPRLSTFVGGGSTSVTASPAAASNSCRFSCCCEHASCISDWINTKCS